MTENEFRVEPKRTLRNITATRLRDAIHTGQLAPNERLSERELCARTGVSRSSIREAIQQLESEGLVRRSTKKEIFVAAITPEEANQIYQIRTALEPAIARLFVENATEDALDGLQAALQDIRAALRTGDALGYARAHSEFFDALMRGSGNEIARAFLRSLESRITRLRILTFARASQTHQNKSIELLASIVEAAIARDPDKIEKRMLKTVRRSADFGREVLEKQPAMRE